MKKPILYFFFCTVIFSCKTKTQTTQEDVFAANIDTSISPGQYFFDYANGKWMKDHPIPAEESSWGIGNIVYNENQQRLRELSEEAAKQSGAKGSASQKIGDFWTAAMDSTAIEKQGTEYLKPYLDEINSV